MMLVVVTKAALRYFETQSVFLLLSPYLWTSFCCLCRPAALFLSQQYHLSIGFGHVFSNMCPVPVVMVQKLVAVSENYAFSIDLCCNSCMVTHTVGYDLISFFLKIFSFY